MFSLRGMGKSESVIAGICICKDEADVIGPVVEHMLTQVDHVIVADNGSTDGTYELLETLPIELLEDPDPAFLQSQKMSALGQAALDTGAEWIVPFDSDEIWVSSDGTIREALSELKEERAVVPATMMDHVATGTDPPEPNPIRRISWRRREPGALPKVACRVADDLVIHQGNHGADYGGVSPQVLSRGLSIHHFPYRSVEQFEKKCINGGRAYEMTDLPETVGAHWRLYYDAYKRGGSEALADHFRKWFWVADPTVDNSLIYDPVLLGCGT